MKVKVLMRVRDWFNGLFEPPDDLSEEEKEEWREAQREAFLFDEYWRYK